ncbi:hypothetical protein MTR67_032061 [Solanum verrucosum]|uniref:3-hydroxyisobutyryl-CoA hydrolase n=1 Tax=Solanum verrucosum TaxID=315347 RepID=A0AAF0U3N0_SOLVR|nr:hypothetical protein MTR67_032061 [Solanum verrucosum]
MSSMPPEVVIADEIGRARMLTLNRPKHLNFISGKVALMLSQKLEKYEKDNNAEFIIIKGAGRIFSAGGDLQRIYDGRNTREYLGLTGVKWKGKEVIAAGLATHFVPSHKLFQLEKSLLNINNGEEDTIFRSVIDEFSTNVQIDETSVLSKFSIIDDCFSRETLEETLDSFEAEAGKKENDWIMPVLKSIKKASPIG